MIDMSDANVVVRHRSSLPTPSYFYFFMNS
jgi:hypothetical protein